MTISDNAAALAFVVAGVTAGSWGAFVTVQLRTLTRSIREIRGVLSDVLGDALAAKWKARQGHHGSDRN
jgi:hypothetical protein